MLVSNAQNDDERRSERLEQRLSRSAKDLIELAAAFQGVTASEFARSHTTRAARETIRSMEGTRLRPADRDAFMRALDDHDPGEALIDLFELHAQAVGRSPDRA